MKKLIDGLMRFQELATGQSPEVLLIACSDSRVVPSYIFQAVPGELFVLRNAGNIVPSYGEHVMGVSATIEYAVQVLKVKYIIVCGHTDSGAMKAALKADAVSHLPAVSAWLKQTERALAVVR